MQLILVGSLPLSSSLNCPHSSLRADYYRIHKHIRSRILKMDGGWGTRKLWGNESKKWGLETNWIVWNGSSLWGLFPLRWVPESTDIFGGIWFKVDLKLLIYFPYSWNPESTGIIPYSISRKYNTLRYFSNGIKCLSVECGQNYFFSTKSVNFTNNEKFLWFFLVIAISNSLITFA